MIGAISWCLVEVQFFDRFNYDFHLKFNVGKWCSIIFSVLYLSLVFTFKVFRMKSFRVFRKFGYQENVFDYICGSLLQKNLLYPNGDFLFSFLSLCPHLPRL